MALWGRLSWQPRTRMAGPPGINATYRETDRQNYTQTVDCQSKTSVGRGSHRGVYQRRHLLLLLLQVTLLLLLMMIMTMTMMTMMMSWLVQLVVIRWRSLHATNTNTHISALTGQCTAYVILRKLQNQRDMITGGTYTATWGLCLPNLWLVDT